MGQLFNGMPVTLLASAARTTSSNTGNLKNTTANFPVCEAAALILDVTALAGVSGVTLDVFIDTSIDGGTTWYPAYEFTNIASSTLTRRLDIRDTGIGVTEVGADTSLAVGSIKGNTVVTADNRIRWALNGSGATGTFAVYGIFQPMGTRGGASG
jgi:hypothetical protein